MGVFKIVLQDFYNSWIDVLDLALNSERYIIIPKHKIVCRDCKKVQTVIQTKEYLSFLCGCGCRVYYPPDKDGVIISKFVSKEDYERGFVGGRRKQVG